MKRTLPLATAAVLALCGTAAAQTKAPAASSSCSGSSTSLCNGWEIGVTLGAEGTGTPGTPISLPASSGGMIGGWLGYKNWNSAQNWYLGGGVDVLYDGTIGSPAGLMLQTVEFGGSLQNFFSGPTTPSQGPISVGPFTAVSPFILSGAAEKFSGGKFIEGWAAGGGAIFSIGGPWDVKTRLINISWGSGTNEQQALATVAYHF